MIRKMTQGERMVWAAEYVRTRGSAGVAAMKAANAVREMREIGPALCRLLSDEDRDLLDDMLRGE